MKERHKHVPLRVCARVAVISIRLCQQSKDNLARQKGEYESVMQVLDEYGANLNWGGLTFSPQDFRANKRHFLNKGARRLLENEPSARSEQDINTLLVALRNIPAFAEYPKKMQNKLCLVGRLETYEPRRVVLREGDPPKSFYFILSGTVLVTSFEEKSGTSRTLVVLTKGMSFGELAVISNTRRQATVCSKTDIELLSISGQEFEEIFMAGGRDVMASERQRQFIRSVRFLQDWPTKELRENTESCSVYYFDRNQVLVRDSNNSDWIYIVLKGSLSVIKKLKRVDAKMDSDCLSKVKKRSQLCRRRGDNQRLPVIRRDNYAWVHLSLNGLDSSVDSSSHRLSQFLKSSRPHVHQIQTPYFKNVMELEHKLEQALPGYHNTADRLGSLDYDHIIQEYKQRLLQKSPIMDEKRHQGNSEEGSFNKSNKDIFSSSDSNILVESQETINDPVLSENKNIRQRKRGFVPKASFLPDISITNKVVRHTRSGNKNDEGIDREGSHEINVEDNDADDEGRLSSASSKENYTDNNFSTRKSRRVKKTLKGVYLVPSKRSSNLSERDSVSQNDSDARLPTEENVTDRKMISREHLHIKGVDESLSEKLAKLQIQYQRRVIDREGRKTISEELDYKARRDYKFTDADLDPTVIELQVLERGQYFGLQGILFPDQPSLSVVSNGAECVVISKKFFLQLASEKCISSLRQTESPYPSDQQLRKKLQEAVNWQASRSTMFRKLQSEVLRKQAKRKQFLPSYQGQYCFRTGPT